MNEVIYSEDILSVVQSFLDSNDTPSSKSLILEIGAELLDVSEDKLLELLS